MAGKLVCLVPLGVEMSMGEQFRTLAIIFVPIALLMGIFEWSTRRMLREDEERRQATRAGLAVARKGECKTIVTEEKPLRAKQYIANGLNVREAAARLKIGKTALYKALAAHAEIEGKSAADSE